VNPDGFLVRIVLHHQINRRCGHPSLAPQRHFNGAKGGQIENLHLLTITVSQISPRSLRHNRQSQVTPRQWRSFCILLTPIKRMALGGARTAGSNVIKTILTNPKLDQVRGVAAPPAAILFCHATKEYAEKGTHAPNPLTRIPVSKPTA